MASRVLPIAQAEGHGVTAVEGSSPDRGRRLRPAFLAEGVPPCGTRQPGQPPAAATPRKTTPRPVDAEPNAAMRANRSRADVGPRIRDVVIALSGREPA